eukprot:TRINITY_DN1703_c0_g1_i12.p1 TRINITY_DN1703_c0_g1~~TRINITY_DN1703_c0_g1_i12.p1  ORF type:complete len:232 (-),score=88.28 TRINITY_DN1703_c0_g1_i12:68-763(-)
MIESLEDYKTHFEIHITKIKKLLKEYPKKSSAEKQRINQEIEKEISGIDSKVAIYETTLRLVKPADAVPYKAFLAQLKKDLFDIEAERSQLPTTSRSESNDLFGKSAQPPDLANMEVQKVIKLGDEYQDKTVKVAEDIQRKLKETHEVADTVLIDLDKVNERLKFVSNELDKADSTMGRLKKYVNYFNRHYMSDKAIMGCIICILVLIVVVLICSFAFKLDNGNFIDKIKK